jgi:hypothetical protein
MRKEEGKGRRSRMMKRGDDDFDRKEYSASATVRADTRSIPLAFYGISIARPDGDFEFNIIKMQIMFAPEQIALAQSEQEMYKQYCAKSDLIMSAIEPNIELLRIKTTKTQTEEEIIKDYTDLLAEMESCVEGYVGVAKDESGDDFKQYVIGINLPARMGSNDVATNGQITSAVKDYETSINTVTENLYRRLNCNARPMFRKAMRLAVRCGYLDPGELMKIKTSSLNKDDVENTAKRIRERMKAES